MIYSRWQILLIAFVCLVGILLAVPNVVSPDALRFLPFARQIHLGLDLKGGAYLLLKVDVAAAERDRLEGSIDAVRRVLRGANIAYTDLRADGGAIRFRLRDAKQLDEARRVLREFVSTGGAADLTLTAAETGDITLKPNEAAIRDRASDAIARTIEIVRRRIDETGVSEPSITRAGVDRISVQLPGIQDPDRVKRLLGTTAKMTFRLVSTNALNPGAPPPPGDEFLPGPGQPAGSRDYLVRRKVEVDGAHLRNASAGMSPQTNEWVVNFEFDAVGARQFGDTTRQNVGRPFAIVLDDRVISAPVIREPITGGRGQISGRFTAADANDLAILLRGGALPAPLTIIEERTVGPNLGADAIRTGVHACLIGGVLVVAFMLFFYRLFGVFACTGMILNLVILIGVLSFLQASLTLPGIVGILLTVGMSVDANVLINERIREEARKGRGVLSSIQTGFSRAMSTIIDANATTLLKMLILFTLASGAVKGFAVTISLGILSSLFTAIVLVRLIISLWYRRKRPKALAL